MRNGKWQVGIGSDLRGRVLGILGLGRHGSLVADYGNAFGMKCIAWSQNLTEEKCARHNVDLVDKTTLLREADFTTVHLKLSERTKNLITLKELKTMKQTSFLVNTSRSEIINETDLVSALKNKVIAGAGLDVFDREPLPNDHPLIALENTVLTPHMGYVTTQTYEIFYTQTLEAVKAWIKGKPIRLLI